MKPSRRALLVAPAAFAAAAFAAPSDETTAFVRRLYARERALPGEMSGRLLRLFDEDARRGVHRAEFYWLHGGQSAPAVSGLRVHTLNVSGTASAAVQARFLNHGRETYRRFHLIREDGRWVIDDVWMRPEDVGLVEVLAGQGA